jgi:uncharacterized membrane protein
VSVTTDNFGVTFGFWVLEASACTEEIYGRLSVRTTTFHTAVIVVVLDNMSSVFQI